MLSARNLIANISGQVFKNVVKNEAPSVASTSLNSHEMRMYFRASSPHLMDRAYENEYTKIQRGHQVAAETYHDDIYEGRPLNHSHDHAFHEQVIHEHNFHKNFLKSIEN
uniref:Uncharacterized protein n=1 Tax=Acrobeloides nanus TaxID=290746 RepID=A0A914E0X2_9BILA